MGWIKLSDQFHADPDLDKLSEAAVAFFVCALSWCGGSLTDGFIPDARVPKLPGGRPEVLEELASVGRHVGRPWLVRVDDGWTIRGYLKYNPDAVTERERLEKQAERKRLSREKAKRGSDSGRFEPVTGDVTRDIPRDVPRESQQTTAVPVPVPVPVPSSKEDNTLVQKAPPTPRFKPPELSEVEAYGSSIGVPSTECARFIDHHQTRDWVMSNRQKMKDWRAALRTWKSNMPQFGANPQQPREGGANEYGGVIMTKARREAMRDV